MSVSFDKDFDATNYYDSNSNLVQFFDNNNNRIYPLKNDPAKYPFKPIVPQVPIRFPKDDITQSKLTALRSNPNPISEKELKIINEVNEIKYRVLKVNNLGQKLYEHMYFVEHDTNISFPDYFTDILDKLIVIFSQATFHYTLLNTNYTKESYNLNKDINKNDYINNRKSGNMMLKDNGKYSINNIIKIVWT